MEEEEAIAGIGTIKSKRDLLERPIEMTSRYHKIALGFGPSGLVTKGSNSLAEDKCYTYDSLNQLTQENDETYSFDSLGNSTEDIVNELNQITATQDETFIYDLNGNITQRQGKEGTTNYTYDALNRLTSIVYPDSRITTFAYDPLSRLHSKNKTYYLYDHDLEIGSIEDGSIKELKVLGLGINGDIGAAVAIELNGKVFAPLHDLQGNIVGLVDSHQNLCETYSFNAFGYDPIQNYQNPWRFTSKRTIDGLIHFGKRFYDPKLKRWLTPDPIGFQGGRNLYAYVFNSPLNRLDLFGLRPVLGIPIAGEKTGSIYVGDNSRGDSGRIYIPISGEMPPIYKGKGSVDGIPISYIYVNLKPCKLIFSPEEIEQLECQALDHLNELFYLQNPGIGFALVGNGVNNTYEDFEKMVYALASKIPVPVFGIYNPTNGLISDVIRTHLERRGYKSDSVKILSGFIPEFLDRCNVINPDFLFHFFAHSEYGAVYRCFFENLLPSYQGKMTKHCYYFGLAPAAAAPKHYGHAKNIYSELDDITTSFIAPHMINNPDYDITMLKPERFAFGMDHSFLSPTLQKGLTDYVLKTAETVGYAQTR